MDLDDSDNYVPGLASQNNSRGHSRFARRAAMATSRFKGVCFNKKCKRWQASTNAYGKYLYLGLYSTETAAAQVYDLASLKIRGRNSQTNFPAEQYLDVNGQLPADEHLDGVIAQLKAEAARQLLAELQDDPMLHGHQAGGNPAEKIALIRQRVGLRRMTGLEQDLLEMIAAEGGGLAENVVAPGGAMLEQEEHAEAAASPSGSPGRTAESLPPVQHEQLDADRLASVVHMSDLSIPTMHQLLQMDEQDIAATSAPQAALHSAGNQLPGSSSGMLESQQLMSGTDWLGASNLPMSAASMLPCVPAVAPTAAAAMPREAAFKQQVWDGSSFRYSQLYGSAAEAARLCGSVLQLIAGCKQGDSETILAQAAANCG
eukprot:gene7148-7363_t